MPCCSLAATYQVIKINAPGTDPELVWGITVAVQLYCTMPWCTGLCHVSISNANVRNHPKYVYGYLAAWAETLHFVSGNAHLVDVKKSVEPGDGPIDHSKCFITCIFASAFHVARAGHLSFVAGATK